MASKIIQAPASLAPAEIITAATAFLASLDKGFEMVRSEIEEANNTDFDRIEFLIKGASAEAFRFSEVIRNAGAALGGEVPQKGDEETNTATGAGLPSSDDLLSDLNHELLYLRSFMEMVEDRANNHSSDGKLVALMDAAMPRLELVMKLAEQLELPAGVSA